VQNRRLTFSAEALRWLLGNSFRGNVRELENVVERAVTLALGSRIEISDLTHKPVTSDSGTLLLHPVQIPDSGFDLDGHLANIERHVLVSALAKTNGVRKDAAQLLGMTFRSFRYRLAKYGLGDADDADEVSENENA
jgi:two-component system response regulator PilR (NtrC family)